MCQEIKDLLYVPLHNHSSNSDGFSSTSRNVQVARDLGHPGIAITDHGTMAGIPDTAFTAEEYGMLSLPGTEQYLIIPDSWSDLGSSRNSKSGRYHITLLATNFEGYKRLVYMNNAAHQNVQESRGKKYPLLTLDMMEEFAGAGVVALTGCVASVTFHDYPEVADEYVKTLIRIFGKENTFAEIMPHVITRNDGQEFNGYARPLALSKKFGLQTVYSTDVHASTKKHLELLRMYTLATKGYEFTASYFQTKEQDFADAARVVGKAEAIRAFQGIDSIVRRIEPINFKREYKLPAAVKEVIKFKEALLERFPKDVEETIGKKTPTGEIITKKMLEDAFKQEWDLLDKYNFWSYFAILWDILRVGHEHGIVTVARGSASGSYFLYLTDVTQLQPIEHGLMFERFLAELRLERGELPDVDVDIPALRRHIIQEYADKKWGFKPVGTVRTHGHSSAVRMIARIYEKMTGNEINKKIVDAASDFGFESSEFKKFIEIDNWMEDMYEGLLDNVAGYGEHACAVVPIDDEMPVPMESWGKGTVVNYSQSGSRNVLQMLGYVKYDLLSSETLETILRLQEITGVKAPKVIQDGDKCFTVFRNQELTGIFQFDTRVGRNLIKLFVDNGININSIRVLSDATSLGRPGPLKENYHVTYADGSALQHVGEHADIVASVFRQTNGVIIYQEQVAELFGRVAFKNYDKEAKEYGIVALKSLVPKNAKMAENEKFKAGYQKMHDMFIKGGIEHHNLDPIYLEELFASLQGFIRYGFNLSHSLSYANISAQLAWYKYYHPQAFWTTILESVSNTSEERGKLMRYIVDATLSSGLNFRPPHINNASRKYRLEDDGKTIQCPISMIKGLGTVVIEDILKNQPFDSLSDINQRTKINKTLKLTMYNAGMFKGLPGDLYDLGVCDIQDFKHNPVDGEIAGVIESVEILDNEVKVTIDGEVFRIIAEHSEALMKSAKKQKVKLITSDSTGVKYLKEGVHILYTAQDDVILSCKRTKYYEPFPEPVKETDAIKKALGFAIPKALRGLINYANTAANKAVGYIVEFEDKTTTNGNVQRKISLQDGRRFWFIVEDNTKDGFLMKKSTVKSLDEIKHLKEGDLVALTLVMAKDKKTGETMTYGQIESFILVA